MPWYLCHKLGEREEGLCFRILVLPVCDGFSDAPEWNILKLAQIWPPASCFYLEEQVDLSSFYKVFLDEFSFLWTIIEKQAEIANTFTYFAVLVKSFIAFFFKHQTCSIPESVMSWTVHGLWWVVKAYVICNIHWMNSLQQILMFSIPFSVLSFAFTSYPLKKIHFGFYVMLLEVLTMTSEVLLGHGRCHYKWLMVCQIFSINGLCMLDLEVIFALRPTQEGTLGPNYCNNTWKFNLQQVQVSPHHLLFHLLNYCKTHRKSKNG